MKLEGPILVVSPHTDDEVIGTGGLIYLARQNNIKVNVLCFSPAMESIPRGWPLHSTVEEFKAAMKLLGVLEWEVKYLPTRVFHSHRQTILNILYEYRTMRPRLVLAPAERDEHQDHAIVAQECKRAFWDTTVLGYEILKRNINFCPEVFVEIDILALEAKMRAAQCYESQIAKKAFCGAKDVIQANALMRGVQCGVQYAEAYEVLRSVILSP